jgi:hypothetical protein
MADSSTGKSGDSIDYLMGEGDPCFDTFYHRDEILPVIENEGVFFDTSYSYDTAMRRAEDFEGFRNGFTDIALADGAYVFEIKTLGWFNVDAYVTGFPQTTLVELLGNIEGMENVPVTLYAFFPEKKNLSVGQVNSDFSFDFKKVDNKIPLFLNEPGILVAFTNRHDKFYYGITHFKVKPTQNIKVNLRLVNEEEFLNAIKNEKIEGINIDVIRQRMEVKPCNESSETDTLAK